MPRPCLPLAAFGLVLATACAEDPSFVLRWQVGRDTTDAEKTLLSVRQCSELGISHVRVTTIDRVDRSEVDTREYPCFPPEFNSPTGTVAGPEIGAGEYDVEVVGLTRRGLFRRAPDGEILGYDKHVITVRESGEGQQATEFRLVGINECDDGVDNDRDGGIDVGDLACRQGASLEGLDNSATLFTFQATLLGGSNPQATCKGLGITNLRVILDGDLAGAQQIPCTTVAQSFSAYLAPGVHSWAVEGIDAGGTAVTQAIAGADSQFEIGSFGFGFVPIAVDIGLETFLTPFNEPLRFSIEYQPYPEAPSNRTCDVSGDFGILELGATIVTLLDENREVVDSVMLADATMGEDAQFPLETTCKAFSHERTTTELMWSAMAGQRGYSLRVETWAAADDPMVDAPCYSNRVTPTRLAPGISHSVAVPRTRTDGTCADCSSKDDCLRCELGVCKL